MCSASCFEQDDRAINESLRAEIQGPRTSPFLRCAQVGGGDSCSSRRMSVCQSSRLGSRSGSKWRPWNEPQAGKLRRVNEKVDGCEPGGRRFESCRGAKSLRKINHFDSSRPEPSGPTDKCRTIRSGLLWLLADYFELAPPFPEARQCLPYLFIVVLRYRSGCRSGRASTGWCGCRRPPPADGRRLRAVDRGNAISTCLSFGRSTRTQGFARFVSCP